ncbi:DUF3618 domain-containing protein [Puerhibacterium puerhi]|uniref:DUF3618 domain-containing protein n=1 Tax=Puerhibacterium puerhi TaxID=2692623 RepID=UPI0013578F7B|nr:DUF3618 domain-containing protein [Puerhibacterium puerhi]
MSVEDKLPRPAAGVGGPAPDGKGPTPYELRSEVERARAELGATIDALTTRLSPAYQAQQLGDAARTAAQDAGTFLTGNGLPRDGDRARNAKVLLGAVVTCVAVVTLAVVRWARR